MLSLACSRSDGHVAATTTGGDLFTWGTGEYGQLGTSVDCTSKISVRFLNDFVLFFTFIIHCRSVLNESRG